VPAEIEDYDHHQHKESSMSIDSPAPLFPLGQLVATPGALHLLALVGISPHTLLQRHVCGDWGELDDTDRSENELALIHGLRIFSSYSLSRPVDAAGDTGRGTATDVSSDPHAAIAAPVDGGKLWIITEADRSATILLLPSEY